MTRTAPHPLEGWGRLSRFSAYVLTHVPSPQDLLKWLPNLVADRDGSSVPIVPVSVRPRWSINNFNGVCIPGSHGIESEHTCGLEPLLVVR